MSHLHRQFHKGNEPRSHIGMVEDSESHCLVYLNGRLRLAVKGKQRSKNFKSNWRCLVKSQAILTVSVAALSFAFFSGTVQARAAQADSNSSPDHALAMRMVPAQVVLT